MTLAQKLLRFIVDNRIFNPIKASAVLGKLASKNLPSYILYPFLKLYIQYFKINLNEFDIDLKSVKNFNEFFIRKLKSGVRVFEDFLVSPSDSTITDFGKLTEDKILSIKGMSCDVEGLFNGHSGVDLKSYAIFYLSPADYHRFHAPFEFELESLSYIPGKLHSVKPTRTDKYNNLYCLNRRVVMRGNTPHGQAVIILVGALVVGRIVLDFFKVKNRKKLQSLKLKKNIEIGEEMGYFELGSTIILMMESDILQNIKFPINQHVNVGQRLV